MAVHKRNTASSPTQEPPPPIARVALYARVSTSTDKIPRCSFGTRGVLRPPRVDHHLRVRRSRRSG